MEAVTKRGMRCTSQQKEERGRLPRWGVAKLHCSRVCVVQHGKATQLIDSALGRQVVTASVVINKQMDSRLVYSLTYSKQCLLGSKKKVQKGSEASQRCNFWTGRGSNPRPPAG